MGENGFLIRVMPPYLELLRVSPRVSSLYPLQPLLEIYLLDQKVLTCDLAHPRVYPRAHRVTCKQGEREGRRALGNSLIFRRIIRANSARAPSYSVCLGVTNIKLYSAE